PPSSRTSTDTSYRPPAARASAAQPVAARDCEAPAERASPVSEVMTPTVTSLGAPWALAQVRTMAASRARRRNGTGSLLTVPPVSAVRAWQHGTRLPRHPGRRGHGAGRGAGGSVHR